MYYNQNNTTATLNTTDSKIEIQWYEEYEDEDEDIKVLKEDYFKSIIKGDKIKVKRILDNGIPVNIMCCKSEITACHLAAYYGHDEILKILIKQEVKFNTLDLKQRTPLIFAVWNGHIECAKILLEYIKLSENNIILQKQQQLVLNDKNKYMIENIEILKNIETMNEVWTGSTPIHIASGRLHSNCIQLLFDFDHKLSLDSDKNYPLDVCGSGYKNNESIDDLRIRFENCINILIEDPHINHDITKKQSTPLHRAVNLSAKDAVNKLVNIKLYRDSIDENGQTPLHLAIISKKKTMLQALLYKYNYNILEDNFIDNKNSEGFSPLHIAVQLKWKKGISVLLKNKANKLELTIEGDTIIHLAVMVGSSSILKNIIKLFTQKELNIENKNGETPLTKAIIKEDKNIIKMLLDEKATITIKSFVETIKKDQKDILKILIEAHNKLPEKEQILNICQPWNTNNKNILHYTAEYNKPNCLKILLDYDMDLKVKTIDNSYTPLHLAAVLGHIEIVELILKKDPLLMNERDFEDWKPFYRAVKKGHRECISLFLQYGADLSEKLVYKRKTITIMALLINNMPRSVEFIEKLFDESISKNKYEINNIKCEITIDYSILLPVCEDDSNIHENQMDVVEALINTNKRAKQRKLLLHPFIESFLYMKWTKKMRNFYACLVALYIITVIFLTWGVVRIYSFKYDDFWGQFSIIIFMSFLIFKESVLAIILFVKNKWKFYIKRGIGIMNLISIILSIIILNVDHETSERYWPRLLIAITILLAWMEITVLLSHFPECGYTFQMFSTVTFRALKVFIIFGLQMIFGFSVAFWIIFQNQPNFKGVADGFVRTFIMTTELEYVTLFEDFQEDDYIIWAKIFFVMFVFFVPIVMMNLILALIISDTNDLKTEGKIIRLSNQIKLIVILDTLIYFLSKKKILIERTVTIYPGLPNWEAISLVSNNIEEELFKRVQNKND